MPIWLKNNTKLNLLVISTCIWLPIWLKNARLSLLSTLLTCIWLVIWLERQARDFFLFDLYNCRLLPEQMRLVKIAEQYLMTVAGCTYVENHEDAYELSEAEGDTEFERCES